MKITVSNFGRQYSNELLIALEEKGWLGRFYTSLAGNKIPHQALPARLQSELRKRIFRNIPAAKIAHYPWLFFFERLLRDRFPRIGRGLGDWFDQMVARSLKFQDTDLVITYENTNRATLRRAKALGKITVLDLAQVHQNDISRFGEWFMPAGKLAAEIGTVNPRKAEALAFTDYVITLSSFAAESMRQHGWPSERLFTVNLGIDPLRFGIKKSYQNKGPLRLLFVGTITRRKGIELLCRTADKFASDELQLTLIGPMADAAQVVRQYPQFHYLPFLHHEKLAEYYRNADVFVFPSLLDSWAQTVLEAMACGTPAIVTENTGAKDAVAQGGGWIIPPNDPDALEKAIRYCLAHRTELESVGRKAHRIAQAYSWENYHRQIQDAILEIARRENLPL